jgi:hypothetical protein
MLKTENKSAITFFFFFFSHVEQALVIVFELVTICNELTLELRGSCWPLVLLQFDDVNFESKFRELTFLRIESVELMKNLLIFVCFW